MPAAAGRDYQSERDALLRQTLAHLSDLDSAIRRAEAQLAQLVPLLGQHLETLPGVGVVLAAELLVGIGDVGRFATPNATFFHLAVAHIQLHRDGRPRCPQSRAYYEKKLGEGKKKKAALTCLMRVLVRVVWRMLRRREPYTKVRSSGAA